MARQATLIGNDGKGWKSIDVGASGAIREQYKYGKFEGFTHVCYLDTSGTVRKKKGAGVKAKPAPKKGAKS
jgi:hypothetical protein